MKILMVCLGNICRSPLAEGIMKSKIEKLNLDWEVDSVGTASYHIGESPDPRSVTEARRNDINISDQKSRQIQKSDFVYFDHILVMDASNFQKVRSLTTDPSQLKKVEMIMNFYQEGKNIQVPDPYYDNGFPKVFEMLDKAIDGFIEKNMIPQSV